jgi:cytochrome c peroxidase
MKIRYLSLLSGCLLAVSCGTEPTPPEDSLADVESIFGDRLPVRPPLSYASSAPGYIENDLLLGEEIDDKLATLGRVLFYDSTLSLNRTISCSSCHQQQAAFGDPSGLSVGLDGGQTGRQSMRLVNIRFGEDPRMFWDERADDLHDQVTQPIQDHIEMGFSGTGNQPGIDSLERRLATLDHYKALFDWAFEETTVITEQHIATALEQFVFSIESFDSRFDDERMNAASDANPFPNFSASENRGKQLFLSPPQINPQGIRTGGGAGCAGCHRPPEFDIIASSHNNGVDHQAGNPAGFDTTNTRSPSLRDVLGPDGQPNTPMMHTGDFWEFTTIVEHYNEVIPDVNNTTVDTKLVRGNNRIQLELTTTEREDLENFIKTLTGSNIYVDKRWSSPF